MPDTPCESPLTTAPEARRRTLLALFGAGIAAATLPHTVHAQAAPTIKRIAAGRNYMSWQFGELRIVALRDGHVDMPPARLRQVNGEALGTLPPGMPLADGKLRLSVNAYVVIEPSRAILIDTGAADTWAPSMGLLPEAMKEAGIDRNSITQVAITHTHRDHVNGLIAADGSDGLPNAQQIYVPREEIATITGRLAALRNRIVPIDHDFAISDHVRAVRAAGHSAGHTMYEASSKAGRLLFWGDIVHAPFVQFGRPEITWELDEDQAWARSTRMDVLRRVTGGGVLVAGAHLDFPGIGQVTRSGQAYAFRPLD